MNNFIPEKNYHLKNSSVFHDIFKPSQTSDDFSNSIFKSQLLKSLLKLIAPEKEMNFISSEPVHYSIKSYKSRRDNYDLFFITHVQENFYFFQLQFNTSAPEPSNISLNNLDGLKEFSQQDFFQELEKYSNLHDLKHNFETIFHQLKLNNDLHKNLPFKSKEISSIKI